MAAPTGASAAIGIPNARRSLRRQGRLDPPSPLKRRTFQPRAGPPAQLARCADMTCFIDPFDRPGDGVLPQRRGLLIVQ